MGMGEMGISSFDGLVAVVTGGASGIGRGIAEALVREGARVVIADIEAGVLHEAAEQIGALPVLTDVSNRDSVQALADRVLAEYGRIDIVINNAGVGHLAPFAELGTDDFAWVLNVNLWGVIHGMSVFLPIVRETSTSGWFVNTASMAGVFDAPGMAAYSASKFAVVALTETIAQELEGVAGAPGVSVLLPGLVNTEIARSERNRPTPATARPRAHGHPIPRPPRARQAAAETMPPLQRHDPPARQPGARGPTDKNTMRDWRATCWFCQAGDNRV
jgi:NAD(P)-dependent dehydrogenase (short-subunit alcohol dehydrogenase family)